MKKIVKESISFQRGQSSKQALNIGLRAKISSWLDGMGIGNYTINEDLTIDVDDHVGFWKRLNGNLPSFIKFGGVSGSFDCSYNKMTSLEGSPESVGGNLFCDNNKLTSLKGSPQSVGGDFFCDNNKVQFTKDDVRKVSEVKGNIHV